MSKLYVFTGATSGVGLEAVRNLAEAGYKLIVGARSPEKAEALRAAVPADQLHVFRLDTEDLDLVRSFAADVINHLNGQNFDGLYCNAGLQFSSPPGLNGQGVERTFATNHLGHFLLVHLLLEHVTPGGFVICTGSGTHDPREKLATMFGFRGGLFPSAEAVSQGELDPQAKPKQICMDLYATSKLCNILFVKDMAKRIPADKVRFLAFDPGLMPGTGLARDRSAFEQWGWRNLLPILRMFPRVSSAARSGAMMAQLAGEPFESGGYPNFTGGPANLAEELMREDWMEDLYQVSARLSDTPPLS